MDMHLLLQPQAKIIPVLRWSTRKIFQIYQFISLRVSPDFSRKFQIQKILINGETLHTVNLVRPKP